ncbi:MAG: HlyD family efflux transporter periplasmic adaptor subunit [Chitinophagaceae bacterium]
MNRTLIAVCLLLTVSAACKQKKIETASPVIAPITEAVFAPGRIESTDQFTLTALNDGYIKSVPVQEGDPVKNGQVLFVQDNASALIQQKTASENLQIAQEQASATSAVLQQLQSQLASAQQKLQNDKTQLDRLQRLYSTHSVAKIDLDNAQLTYNNSVNSVAGLEQNIAATKLNLKQTVVNSRSQQQTATVNAGYYNIKSPGNYRIYSLLKKNGELVRRGEAVAILGKNDLHVVLDIDEASISKIQLQQKVLVELNTEKGNTYTANVSKIYPQYDASAQAYTVEASFDTIPPQLINGTLLQANIIVAKKGKALLIPRNCYSADGKVLIQREKSIDTVTIKAGIISTDWVEVLGGISEKDKLVKAF